MRIAVYLVSSSVPAWTFNESHAQRLRQELSGVAVTVCENETAFLAALPDAEVALVWQFKQEWLSHADKLKRIATPAAGRDYFLIDPDSGIEITYGSFHGELMAETVLAMILAECRGIADTLCLQDSDPWPKEKVARRMRPLRGSHVAILGFGNIGRWIGRLAKPFGVRLTGIKRTICDPPSYFESIDRIATVSEMGRILPSVDHLVLALPGDSGTDNIIDAEMLSHLPHSAVIYNVGRGNAIDEDALAAALNCGELRGAYLDVFQTEPLPEDSPLRSPPRTLLMPHASAIAPNYLDLFLDEFINQWRSTS